MGNLESINLEYFKNFPLSFFVLNEGLQIIYANNNVAKIFADIKNYQENSLLVTDLFEPIDKKRITNLLKRHKSGCFVSKVLVKNNSLQEVNCNYSTFQLKDSKNYYSILTINSLSDCTKSETYDINSNNLAQIILDSVPTPIYYKDKNGRFIGCNMAFEKFINSSKYSFLNKVDGFKKEELLFLNDDEKIHNEKRRINSNVIINSGENNKKYISLTKSPFINNNWEYGGFIGVLQDITSECVALENIKKSESEVIKSEKLFRSIWENSIDGMRLIDENGIILMANKAFCKIVGIDESNLVGNLFTIIYKDNSAEKISLYKERIAKGSIKDHAISKEILWNNNEIWLEVTHSRISLESQTPIFLSIFRNITSRTIIENELKRRVALEGLIANISSSLVNIELEQFDNVVNNNLKTLGEFLETSFIGVFIKTGNMVKLINYWYKDESLIGNTFIENYRVLSNLKMFKKLSMKEVLLLKDDNENYLLNYRIVKSNLQQHNTKSIILLPVLMNNELNGYIAIESVGVKINLFFNEFDQILTISDVVVNALKRKKHYEIIAAEKEELDVTLKSISDGVITVNNHETIVNVNYSTEKILGFEVLELLGKNIRYFATMLFKDSENRLNKELERFNQFINPTESKSDTFKINTKSGSPKILNISVNKMQNQKGELTGYVYAFLDMTKSLNEERSIALSQKMESIGQLAAGIAHEINTPMQYINDNNKFLNEALSSFEKFLDSFENKLMENDNVISLVEWYREARKEFDLDYFKEESLNALTQSKIGIDRVIKIIKAMKDFSHPGQKDKNYANLNEAIEITSTICRNEWKYFADLELNLTPNLPQVLCTIDEINQVILNMIINSAHAIDEAIQMGKKEKGLIKISTILIDNFVEIDIEDTGIGILPENLNKIFDLFFTTKKVGKGTGQGLSIAHDIIVNKHNGKIMVDSEYKKGTIFKILLPV